MIESNAAKHQLVLFDGLRGVAALLIVLRHTSSYWGFTIYRTYLAVDIFFILSGFVIGLAYDQKLTSGAMSKKQFLFVRFVRLYPMYLISVGLCIVLFLIKSATDADPSFSIGNLLPTLLPTLFVLPSRAENNDGLFPLNGVYWSLFFEAIVNAIFIALQGRLTRGFHLAILAVAGMALIGACLINGNLDVGFTWSKLSWLAGFARSIFGFFAGLYLFRFGPELAKFNKAWLSPHAAFVVVIVILLLPSLGSADGVIDCVACLVIFPLCIFAMQVFHYGMFNELWLRLGALSYPLYVLHAPFALILSALAGGREKWLAPAAGLVLITMLISLVDYVTRKFEKPMQTWLRDYYSHAAP